MAMHRPERCAHVGRHATILLPCACVAERQALVRTRLQAAMRRPAGTHAATPCASTRTPTPGTHAATPGACGYGYLRLRTSGLNMGD